MGAQCGYSEKGALSYLYVTSAPRLVPEQACWKNEGVKVLEIGPSKGLSSDPLAFPVSLGAPVGFCSFGKYSLSLSGGINALPNAEGAKVKKGRSLPWRSLCENFPALLRLFHIYSVFL